MRQALMGGFAASLILEVHGERMVKRIALGDDAAFDSAWQEGRGLTLDQAIELALAKPVESA